jgi:hypothetical protein
MKDRIDEAIDQLVVEAQTGVSFWKSVARILGLRISSYTDSIVYFKGKVGPAEDINIEHTPGNRPYAPKDYRLLSIMLPRGGDTIRIPVDTFEAALSSAQEMAGLIRSSIMAHPEVSAKKVKRPAGGPRYKLTFLQDLMDDEGLSAVPEYSITGTLSEIFEKLEEAGVLDSALSTWGNAVVDKIKGSHVEVYEVDNPNERDFVALSAPGVAVGAVIAATQREHY